MTSEVDAKYDYSASNYVNRINYITADETGGIISKTVLELEPSETSYGVLAA